MTELTRALRRAAEILAAVPPESRLEVNLNATHRFAATIKALATAGAYLELSTDHANVYARVDLGPVQLRVYAPAKEAGVPVPEALPVPSLEQILAQAPEERP